MSDRAFVVDDRRGPLRRSYLASEPAARLTSGGILRFHAVSCVLPRTRVDLDLLRLARELGEFPLAEMLLLSGLHKGATTALPLIQAFRGEACQHRPEVGLHPLHLVVRALGRVLEEALVPMGNRTARALCEDVEHLLRRDIADKLPGESMLIFS